MAVNAIDFSDLTEVKKKTQPVKKPQGFYSPDKVPEQKKQQPASMGYPTQKTRVVMS